MSRQQSNKSGVRSTAQKEDEARYDYETVPAASQVNGATGGNKQTGRTVQEVGDDYAEERMRERARKITTSKKK